MATGIFKLRDQLLGLVQKAWTSVQVPTTTYAGSFNGSNQNLTVANNSAFLFGTGDFTVECFFNPASITSAAANQGLVGMWGTGSQTSWLLYYTGGTFIWYTSSTGSAQAATLTVTKAITVGTWYHVALVRYSGTTTIYINGTSAGSTSTVVNLYAATCALSIAITPAGGTPDYVNGSLSNLRIVKGVAVYTSNFAVPTSPLTNLTSTSLLTLQNATIIDNSSNAFTITNVGSVTTSANTTIFVNPSIATPAVEYLVVAGGGGGGGADSGGGGGGLIQGIVPVATGSALTVTVGGGGNGGNGSSYTAGTSGQNSVFNNVTAIGGGGGGAVNSNGGSGGSGGGGGTGVTAPSTSGGSGIFGQGNAGGANTIGNANNLPGGGGGGAGTVGLPTPSNNQSGAGGAGIASSIVGTAYVFSGGGGGGCYNNGIAGNGGVGGGGGGTSLSGTQGTGGSGYNSGGTGTSGYGGTGGVGGANSGGGGGGGSYGGGNGGTGGSGICIISYPDTYNAPTTLTGTYTASTSGSGSFAPLNTSSWIYYNAPSNLQFGTGDFTIECWIYLTSLSGTNYIFDFRGTNSPAGSSFGIFQNSGGLQTFSTNLNVNYGVPAANTWYNVVWSRTSGVSYFFVNGTLVNAGGTADTTSYTAGTNGPSFAGTSYYSTYGLQGYMSNLRVLKGTGLYTSNFTPSTKPLTAITNTSLLLSTVSGAYLADGSTNANTASVAGTVSWNQASPFATGLGYKNRVYTWTASGTVTF